MNLREISEITAVRQHYESYGIYTKLPSESPSWIKFWEQERDRCLNGYHIGSDYISGYLYDYLQYSPIMIAETIEIEGEVSVRADRIEGFPEWWDELYQYAMYLDEAEKSGKHAFLLGSRRKGKSFFAASMCNRNYFHIKKSKSYVIASNLQYLTQDGIMNKVIDIMNFRDMNTPWAKRRQYKDTELHKRASIQENRNGRKVETGWMSEIIAITVGDNPNKVRGKAGKLVIFEEVGSFPKLLECWRILRPSMQVGDYKIGMSLGIGTGGDVNNNFMGAEEIWKHPVGYEILPIIGNYEPALKDVKTGYFWGADLNWKGCYDECGYSDRVTAKISILKERKNITENSSLALETLKYTAEFPLTPSELMLKISGTQFPLIELKIQEAEIETKPHLYRNAEHHVLFELNKDTQLYEPKTDHNAMPLYHYPHFDNKDKPGCFIIYKHPIYNKDKEVYSGRYLAGIDSFDMEESTTDSLGSLFIIDSWTMELVAEYTGRPKPFDFYETCRRGLLYYKAIVAIENLNKGIMDYFDSKNSGYLIEGELSIAREIMQDGNSTSRRGINPAQVKVIAYGRGLITRWLLSSTNNPDKPEEIHVHINPCLPLIKELISWNSDQNFDRVSAITCLMLLCNDREKYNMESEVDLRDTIANDPYLQQLLPRHLRLNSTFLNKI